MDERENRSLILSHFNSKLQTLENHKQQEREALKISFLGEFCGSTFSQIEQFVNETGIIINLGGTNFWNF